MKFQSLQVLADPEHKGKHPYHEARYITTAGASFEELHGPREWEIENGQIIAQMRDCVDQKHYARLFAAAPELAQAAENALNELQHWHGWRCHESPAYADSDGFKVCAGRIERLRAALAAVNGQME